MALWKLYIGLTAIEALLLWGLTEMNLFEGVCHAFTTLAAGGVSPHGRSLAGYSAAAQWIVIPFMFLAGSSFALQYRALRYPKKMLRDTEFRTYAGITIAAAGILAILLATSGAHRGEAAVRHGLFQTASILTTTGYASDDFNYWQQAPLMVLGCLMFIGGCAGSAGGGPKVVRIVILIKYVAREMLIALHPRAVRRVSLGGRPVGVDTLRQVIGFFIAYVLIFSVMAVATGVIENDFRVGLTGSIVTLGNIGPGYGSLGPMETFAGLSVATKLLFALAMWIGRLEVMTVIVLFHPDVMRTILARRRTRSRGG
jgi:trk system potassium uptake protein TrkH